MSGGSNAGSFGERLVCWRGALCILGEEKIGGAVKDRCELASCAPLRASDAFLKPPDRRTVDIGEDREPGSAQAVDGPQEAKWRRPWGPVFIVRCDR